MGVPLPAYSFGTDKADLKKEMFVLGSSHNISVICYLMLVIQFRFWFILRPNAASDLMRQMCEDFWASFYQFKKSSCEWRQKFLMF